MRNALCPEAKPGLKKTTIASPALAAAPSVSTATFGNSFLERGELFYSRVGFVLRWLAIEWAEEERKAMEKGDLYGQ